MERYSITSQKSLLSILSSIITSKIGPNFFHLEVKNGTKEDRYEAKDILTLSQCQFLLLHFIGNQIITNHIWFGFAWVITIVPYLFSMSDLLHSKKGIITTL